MTYEPSDKAKNTLSLNVINYLDSINYAIFVMAVAKDDEFNENETRKHLFILRELVEKINEQNDLQNS